MLTPDQIAELSALILTAPAPPPGDDEIAAEIAALMNAMPTPRPPKKPKVTRDHQLARLRGAVTLQARRVAAADAARVAIAAAVPRSPAYWAATYDAIGALAGESTARLYLAQAQAALAAYEARAASNQA